MSDRIWVEANGLRVRGRGKSGGHWEDGQGDEPKTILPFLTPLSWLRPLLKKGTRPVPCLSIWIMFLVTTVYQFWNALPDNPLEGLEMVPPDFQYAKEVMVGACTAVYGVIAYLLSHNCKK